MAKQTKHTTTTKNSKYPTATVGTGTSQASSPVQRMSHWPLVGVFMVVFGSIGLYMLFRSSAGSIPNGSIFSGRYVISSDGATVTPQNYPAEVENTKAGLLIASPTMSGDGKKVAYYTVEGNKIKVFDTQNTLQSAEVVLSTTRKAQSVATMQWNSDATKLAVQYQIDAGIMRILTMNADGTNLVELPASWNMTLAGWSPDSSGLVYIKDYQEICTFAVATQANTCNKIQGYTSYDDMGGTLRARLAPNGSSVTAAYKRTSEAGGQTKLLLVDTSGAGLRELVVPAAGVNIPALSWSPNSENITYATSPLDNAAQPELHVANVATKEDKLLSAGDQAGDISQLDWVITDSDWQRQEEASVAPTTPINVSKSIVATASSLGAMKDVTLAGKASAINGGKKVAYMAARSNPSASTPATVQVVPSQGGDASTLVALPDWEANWALDGISPDGRWLALRKTVALDTKRYIQGTWLVRNDGSQLHEVAKQLVGTDADGYSFSWKSDSTGFYYVVPATGTNQDAVLCSQKLDGTTKQCKALTDAEGFLKTATVALPTTSNDGASVAFVARNATGTQAAVYVTDVNQASATKLKDLGSTEVLALSWSLDGSQIGMGFRGSAGTGVYVIDIDGSNFDQVNPVAEQFVWIPENN